MAAAKAMSTGNWQDAIKHINSIKVWDFLLSHKEKVKEMLAVYVAFFSETITFVNSAIQEESLRTYIFTYAPHYECLGIDTLGSMFSLSNSRVKTLISKMISQDHLVATFDANDEFILLDSSSTTANTRLEYLLNYFADKSSVFADANDKLVEAKNLASGDSRKGNTGKKHFSK